eukprot:TRINITY_DN64850_c0_g1_i1.p1 TRINITY_DN64850_c0_g1~~TRINITY_DN64850_c0_g1_i1.p1  ORF type:complete len:299 (+),score=23.89 TRINITY_DN64850_c0_g1_i1:107-1003(+)
MALWQGILIMIVRAMECSTAKNLQRYAQRPGQHRPYLNLLGVVMKICAGPMDALAYSIAPQMTLAPFCMALGLSFDFLAAERVHGDQVGTRHALGGLLVVAGTVICLSTGAVSSEEDRLPPTTAMLMTYALVVILVLSVPITVIRSFSAIGTPSDGVAHAVLGGTLGSSTLVAGKLLIAELRSPEATLLSICCCVAIVAIVVPAHLFVLNRAYGRVPLVFLSPCQGALGLLVNIATGYFLYSEAPVLPYAFCFGVFCLIGAVAVLIPRQRKTCQADEAVAHAMVQSYSKLGKEVSNTV